MSKPALVVALLIAVSGDPAVAARVWVDVDAACDGALLHDVDDCLALLHLERRATERVVAVSTVFGNATRDEVDDVMAALLERWTLERGSAPPRFRGARERGDCAGNAAAEALVGALVREPLEVLALGPLTNLACALALRPDLATRVVRVVAVMGAREGHVFHPAEDAAARSWLGHGPTFDDVNASRDPAAVGAVLDAHLALFLMPYENARWIELDAASLARVAETGAMARFVAERSRNWSRFWRETTGRRGFYPFDLAAAFIVTDPDAVRCVALAVRLGNDRRIGWFGALGIGPRRLLLDAPAAAEGSRRYAKSCRIAGTPPVRSLDLARVFAPAADEAGLRATR